MCFLTLYIKLGTKKILSSLKWLEADNCLNKILGLLMYFRACYPNYHGRLAKVFWPNTGKMSRFVCLLIAVILLLFLLMFLQLFYASLVIGCAFLSQKYLILFALQLVLIDGMHCLCALTSLQALLHKCMLRIDLLKQQLVFLNIGMCTWMQVQTMVVSILTGINSFLMILLINLICKRAFPHVSAMCYTLKSELTVNHTVCCISMDDSIASLFLVTP